MNFTAEQRAVEDAKIGEGEMVKVVAFAGTGKTTSFAAFSRKNINPILYLAFNKSVAEEAKSKFPRHVTSKTGHAVACAEKGKNYPVLANEVRYYNVTKFLKIDVYSATLVCQTLENWLASADDNFELKHAAPDELKRLKGDPAPNMLLCAKAVWEEMVQQRAPFQMTHNGYLKLYQLSKPKLMQKYILLDEAQDTNPVMFDLVNRQRQFGTRVLLAGDPYQQIYSWRGAVDAMQAQDCRALYLTQSFRFGNNVASVANKLLSTFFSEKVPLVGNGQPDGIVTKFPPGEKFTVICRTNVELYSRAVPYATRAIPFHVIGERSFVQFLSGLLDIFHLYTGNQHLISDRSLSFYRDYEAFKAFATSRMDVELLSKAFLVERHKEMIPHQIKAIKEVNTFESHARVILVTAHKAKGLEWDNVVLADDFEKIFDEQGRILRIKQQVLIDPAFDDKTRPLALEDAIEKDEINLLYVAATRAKRNLVLNSALSTLMSLTPAEIRHAPIRVPAPTTPIAMSFDNPNEAPVRRRETAGRVRDLFDRSDEEKYEDTEY